MEDPRYPARRRLSPPQVRRTLERGLVAAGLTLLALVLTLWLSPLSGNATFFLFLVAIMLSAFYGGLIAGLFSAILAIVGHLVFVYDRPGSPLADAGYLLVLLIFAAFATVISAIIDRRRYEGRLVRRQAALIDLSPDGILTKDLDGTITSWSRGAEQMYGYTADEALGRTTQELLETRFPEPYENIIAYLEHEGRWRGDLIHRRRDGAPITVDSRWLLERRERDEPSQVMESNVDITARKQYEEDNARLVRELGAATAASEFIRRQLEAVFEAVADGIMVFDPAGRVVFLNEAEARITGYADPDEMKRDLAYFARVFQLYDANGRILPVDEWPVSRVLRGEAIHDWELSGRRLDTGQEWYFSYSGEPVRDEQGRLTLAVLITRDVTERHRGEEALRVGEERMRSIVNTVLDGVVTIDDHGIIQTANPAVEKLFGYRTHELIGRNVSLLASEPDKSEHDRYMDDYRRTGLKKVVGIGREVTALRKDGSEFPIELSVSEFWLDGRRYFTGVMHDLTERKRAEAEREELLKREQAARAQAEAAVGIRDQFISIASHELKTPLTSIRGYADLLVQRAAEAHLSKGNQRMLTAIHQQSIRLEKMIRTMLDVTRIEKGQIGLERGRVDICELVQRVVEDTRPTLRKHTLDFQANVKRAVIEGDEMRLEQVFQNLIQNAIKYSPLGGPVLVQIHADAESVQVLVKDSGIGIPESALPSLFTRFYRAPNAVDNHISGLGVGLYVVREIARLHGGDILVSSEEGKGSTFTVVLPRESKT